MVNGSDVFKIILRINHFNLHNTFPNLFFLFPLIKAFTYLFLTARIISTSFSLLSAFHNFLKLPMLLLECWRPPSPCGQAARRRLSAVSACQVFLPLFVVCTKGAVALSQATLQSVTWGGHSSPAALYLLWHCRLLPQSLSALHIQFN